jgi:hypothetical protein
MLDYLPPLKCEVRGDANTLIRHVQGLFHSACGLLILYAAALFNNTAVAVAVVIRRYLFSGMCSAHSRRASAEQRVLLVLESIFASHLLWLASAVSLGMQCWPWVAALVGSSCLRQGFSEALSSFCQPVKFAV